MSMLRCRDLKKYFSVQRGILRREVGLVRAVDGVSLTVERGVTFGLVGESGCGKTTLGKIILGILAPDSGSVRLATDRRQAVFQDPVSSLDPKMRVFDILAEGLVLRCERRTLIRERVREAADLVKLPSRSLAKYPHQFSGGERQRIAIGRAIVTRPEFIVCDEPVSHLDVTIQLQILMLLKEIQKRMGITYFFISHDLRVVKFMCDTVAVMHEGKIVEEGAAEALYSHPAHPYTKLLLSSVLRTYPYGHSRPH